MKHLLTIISAILLFTACSKDDDNGPDPVSPAQRTVIVYMVGENSLNPYMQSDINSKGWRTKGNVNKEEA